ncbi:ABC transporter permease [Embleya sp. NPDC005575]|uniref:ABC transporter permease n=1 Tax=Embleya sp. NPDC005575 TaxID=3156892 RepID=UPI0033B3AF9D
MTGYLLRRLPSALLVLVLASFAIFAILRLIPGDPATTLAGSDPSPDTIAAIRVDLGLDRPFLAQYFSWIGDLLSGDPGRSYLIGGQITDLIGDRFGNTLALAVGALVLMLVLGPILGVLGATARGRIPRALLGAVNSVSLTVPVFVTGVLLVLLFAVTWRLLPPGGHESIVADPVIGLQYLVLPALCLALPGSAVIARYIKDGVLQALGEDYVRTARSLGVSHRRILWRHALPNALPPVLTVLGMQVGALLGGAVVVEALFAWPGLGQLAEQGVARRDYPVVQTLLLLLVGVYVLVQLLTDIAYALLDPRVRLG